MCGGPAGPGLPQVGLGCLQVLVVEGELEEEAGQAAWRSTPHEHPAGPPLCRSQVSTERFLHLRYQGTDCALMVSAQQHPATAHSPRAGDFGAAFVERYGSARPGSPEGWPASLPAVL